MKLLLTAFDPFAGEPINPAMEAVKLVPEKIGDIQIIKCHVPTVFKKSIELVTQAMEEHHPDAVLCIGQAGGRPDLAPELFLRNTGRISSTDPNLQNIPTRTELGRELRKIFIPEEGYLFVDADYSQIELRVLAHMSGDDRLISAYNQAEDIHAITASQVFGVPLSEVTPELRRNAKAVNFGIVYGISAFGLSEDLSITRKEAQEYMDQYFKSYPSIKNFLNGLVESAKETGVSRTMFGRIRPVTELKAQNFMQRQFGERIAMNAPIQGTAADIIKIAMVRVDRRLKKELKNSRLILQIHDELLIEAARDEVEAVKTILSEEMSHAADLAVRLETSMSVGGSWYETK